MSCELVGVNSCQAPSEHAVPLLTVVWHPKTLNPSNPTSSMVEYPKQNHQSTTASMHQEHQYAESANLLEHSGNDHQNNANDVLALFQCIVHRLPL